MYTNKIKYKMFYLISDTANMLLEKYHTMTMVIFLNHCISKPQKLYPKQLCLYNFKYIYIYIKSVRKYCNGSLFNISLIRYSKNLCSGTLKVHYEVVMKKQEYSVCP